MTATSAFKITNTIIEPQLRSFDLDQQGVHYELLQATTKTKTQAHGT